METLFFFIPERLAKALGWMVLHSIWQATLIGLLAGIGLIMLRHHSARARYWTANAALLLLLLTAAATFQYFYQQPDFYQQAASEQVMGMQDITAVKTPFTLSSDSHLSPTVIEPSDHTAKISLLVYFSRNLPVVVTLWFLGMSLFLLRLLGNFGYIYYLKSHLNFPTEQFWHDLLQGLIRKINIKTPIRLLESALVRTPMVVGYLKPVILFPIGMINRLDPEQVEAILAHELAHIAHHDYLFNVLQSMVETLFYYHPAVWWLSSSIRHEREIAADDAAVRLTGNSIQYAKSLVMVQDMARMPLSPSLAFAGNHNNQLLQRIQHILHIKQSTNLAMEKVIGTCAILLALIGLGYAQNKNTTQNPDPNPQTALSVNALSGIWEGTIKDNQVCMSLSSRTEHSSWMNGDCFAVSDFSALPTVESEFTMTRPAGVITFKGKFENKEGYGRFHFDADKSFTAWLSDQGISELEEEAMVHLFFANISKDYVVALKKAGYNKISGEDLQNLAIHRVDQKRIADYQVISQSLGEGQPSIETMLNLTIHDISSDYINNLSKAGFGKLSLDDILTAKIHGISPEYAQKCREMGFDNLSFDEVLNFKIHEITPEFLSDLKKSGIGPLSADEALNMRIHDMSPEEIAAFRKMGFKDLSPEDLLNLKIQDVTPAFLDEMRKAGFEDISTEEALNLKIQDVTPSFVEEMHKAGFKNLSAEDAMNLKIHDVTAAYIQQLNKGGFTNLSIEDALNCKIQDVNPADLAAYAKLGFTKINVDDAVNLKIHEVTPAFIESMRNKGFTDLDLEEYINLKIQYGHKVK